jgi:hypothetical protein
MITPESDLSFSLCLCDSVANSSQFFEDLSDD